MVKLKRILAALLCTSIIASTCTAQVFATENEPVQEPIIQQTIEQENYSESDESNNEISPPVEEKIEEINGGSAELNVNETEL